MTRTMTFILACNVITMLLTASACYFAFDARKQARYASYDADQASENSRDAMKAISRVAQQVDVVSATSLRIEDQLGRHVLYSR
ncbi:hypothetical protein PSCICL_47800 [Pseudomonas cichorii]|nr:hypothetical protein PSCICL_47800 [Pseudomonas cichorii]